MELRPFGTLTIETDPDGLFMLSPTAVHLRIIQEFLSVRLTGERLSGRMIAKSGADWLTVDDQGRATIDIRVLLLTDDDAHVFVTLDGRASWGAQLGQGPIYSTVRLESGDERYQWVNGLPLVSKGEVIGRAVAHELYELI
jgi:Protein of unknown function (DUF3237)